MSLPSPSTRHTASRSERMQAPASHVDLAGTLREGAGRHYRHCSDWRVLQPAAQLSRTVNSYCAQSWPPPPGVRVYTCAITSLNSPVAAPCGHGCVQHASPCAAITGCTYADMRTDPHRRQKKTRRTTCAQHAPAAASGRQQANMRQAGLQQTSSLATTRSCRDGTTCSTCRLRRTRHRACALCTG